VWQRAIEAPKTASIGHRLFLPCQRGDSLLYSAVKSLRTGGSHCCNAEVSTATEDDFAGRIKALGKARPKRGVSPWLLIAFLLAGVRCGMGQDLLTGLQRQHPRLLLHTSDLMEIQNAIKSDPYTIWAFHQTLASGEQLLKVRPDTYEIGGPEHTLLTTSRDMEERILTLAGLFLVARRKDFARRATQEMPITVSFKQEGDSDLLPSVGR